MNILTPTGYKNIEDVNIGDELIAYDINTGDIIVNTLLKKELWTNDMLPSNPPTYQSVYNEETLEYEEVLVYDGMSSEEVFQETHGDWKFYEINGTWKVYKHQSIWANMKVVHISDLKIGDVVYDDKDNDVVVTSIVECVEPSWWRLEVSGDHSYISDNLQLHNASRYWSGNMTPTSFNWNFTTGGTNWGSASGVADNATVPTSVDDVFFDGVGVKGNTNSTISATITVLSYTVTSGYTATMTFNATLTVSTNITLSTPYTLAGSSGITNTGSGTITSNGKIWSLPFSFTGTVTKTLVGNLTITGLLSYATSTTITFNRTTTEEIIVSNLFSTTAVLSIGGTAILRIVGGNIDITNGTLAGTTILDGNIVFTVTNVSNSLTYQSGNITGTKFIKITGAITLNTNGMSFNTVNVFNNITVTLNSTLTVTGTLTPSFNNTFSGTSGFIVGTLSKVLSSGGSLTLTLQNGVTYIINNSFATRNTANLNNFITSNDATLRANLILTNGATCNVSGNFTRINATGGRTINTWNSTVTNCLNVRNFTDLQGVSNTIIN
jgi:hypothetical protein